MTGLALNRTAVVQAAAAAGIGNGRGTPSGHAIAVWLGLSPATVARAMAGRPVSLPTLLALSQGLSVPAETLLSGSEQ